MSTVIGQFEGKCADANVVNANNMEIGRDVWSNVFESDEYKLAIQRGHYIGYLGHPEDPGCQDFQNACIVLKECHMENDGQVFGKFDLIDTPVGRIVKSFIDAGVKFGISVRGAGDVIGGVVDPDTFVFRGFDLVAFPAYSDAVPAFTEISASSDIEKQKAYKKICATIDKNLPNVQSSVCLDTLQQMFSSKSTIYKAIDTQKNRIACNNNVDVMKQKIEATTSLYLDAVSKVKDVKCANQCLQEQLKVEKGKCQKYRRKLDSMYRILSSQQDVFRNKCSKQDEAIDRYKAEIDKFNKQLEEVSCSSNKELERKYTLVVSANTKLKKDNELLRKNNLCYKQEISSSKSNEKEKDSIIASLQQQLSQTVTAAESADKKLSNRDKKMKELKADVDKAIKVIEQYQDAFASLYACAIGVKVDSIPINANTSVDELKKLIDGGTSTCNVASLPSMHIDQIVDDEDADSSLITV